MDLFRKAKSVRLISYTDKYLVAESDEETISQVDNETLSQQNKRSSSIWTVEIVDGKDLIRLRSCFDTYLTASSTSFMAGVTGKKVVQTAPSISDPATEWEPLRDGMQVRLKSFCGNFLRPHSSLPPWRNAITNDIPHLPQTRNKLLWDVIVVEKRHATSHDNNNNNKFGRTRSRSFSASMSPRVQNGVTSQEII